MQLVPLVSQVLLALQAVLVRLALQAILALQEVLVHLVQLVP